MYLLILFLVFLLIILIYNNTNTKKIENYVPKDNSRSFDVRLCRGEENDILTPEYDRDYNLNEIKNINIINDEEQNIIKQIKIIKKDNGEKQIQLTKIKTNIEDPFYHTFNIELMDNFESVKSDYSIINNIKLEDNQTYVPKNYTLMTK
jgi:hypothetical protein